MRIFLCLLVFSAGLACLDLHIHLAPISNYLQNICFAAVANSPHSDLQKALVCGINLPQNSAWQKTLIQTGLIHLVVVSGSHFIVLLLSLEWLAGKFRIQQKAFKFTSWIVLLLYALTTGLQAPAIRALFGLALTDFSYFFRLNLSRLHILIYSVLLSLAFAPAWYASLSLILSATATLALLAHPHAKIFTKQCLVFLLLLPALASLQTAHPIHIVSNLVLGPLLSLILLPVAVITLLIPPLLLIFTSMAEGTLWVLQVISPLAPSREGVAPLMTITAYPMTTTHLLLWTIWIFIWIYLDQQHRQQLRTHWYF